MAYIAFLIVFFFAYTVQAVTGFAGNVFAMAAGVNTIGLNASVSLLNITGCLSCGFIALANYKDIVWKELLIICAGMLPFMFIGIWVNTFVQLDILLKIYGVTIVVIALRNIIVKKQQFMPRYALVIVLFLAGLMQGMFVSGGALLVIYAVQRLKDKEQFRATLSALWMFMNLIYAAIAGFSGHFTFEVFTLVLVCIPVSALAIFLGSKIQKRINADRFLKITYWLLLLVGISLFITS